MRLSSLTGSTGRALNFKSSMKLSGPSQKPVVMSKKDDENNTDTAKPFVINNDSADIVSKLQKQIKSIQASDKFDDKTKKEKIDAIMQKIEALQKQERKTALKEVEAALNGNKDEIKAKAKQRKNEFDKQLKEEDSVDIGFSVESFANLITAELEIGKAQEARVFKAEKERDLTRAQMEVANDVELGQSIQNEIKGNDIVNLSGEMTGKAIEEFVDKYGTVTDCVNELKGSERINAVIGYTKAMLNFVTTKISEYINSDEFNSRYEFSTENKNKLLDELENVLGNIENSIVKALAKANNAAGGTSDIDDSDADVASDAVESAATGIGAEVVARVTKDLG